MTRTDLKEAVPGLLFAHGLPPTMEAWDVFTALTMGTDPTQGDADDAVDLLAIGLALESHADLVRT
jgi:hypothetical protein